METENHNAAFAAIFTFACAFGAGVYLGLGVVGSAIVALVFCAGSFRALWKF